MVGQNKFLIF